jgi:glutaredoxin 3
MAAIQMYTSQFCGYCQRAKRLLDKKGVAYEQIYLHLDPGARKRLVEMTGRWTVPQIIVDDRPIGGWDELKALDDQGRLDEILGVAA